MNYRVGCFYVAYYGDVRLLFKVTGLRIPVGRSRRPYGSRRYNSYYYTSDQYGMEQQRLNNNRDGYIKLTILAKDDLTPDYLNFPVGCSVFNDPKRVPKFELPLYIGMKLITPQFKEALDGT